MPGSLEGSILQPEVGVVCNRDASGISHHDVLSFVESFEVSFLVSNSGSIDCSIEFRIVVFTIVIAVGGVEKLDHVGSIVVVHYPSVTSNLIFACTTHRSEGSPLNFIDVHGDADFSKSVLEILSKRNVVTSFVGGVGDYRESFTVGIASFSKSFFSKLKVLFIIVADIGATVCSYSVIEEVAFIVNNARAHEVVSGSISALHYNVSNVLTVDSKRDCFTYKRIVERLLVDVHRNVVSTKDGIYIEVAAVLSSGKRGDFFGRNVFDHKSFTGIVSSISSGGILEKEESELIGNDLAVIPAANIVFVLLANDTLAGNPLNDLVRAVADIGRRIYSPAVSVSFNSCLLNGGHGSEGSKFVKVRARIRKNNGKGLSVFASFYVEVLGIAGLNNFVIAVNHSKYGLAVRSCKSRVNDTFEGILKVFSGEVTAIGPFKAVTHSEFPCKAVFRNSVALCLSRNYATVLIDDEKSFKKSDEHVTTIDCAVKSGVKGLGVRSDLNSDVGKFIFLLRCGVFSILCRFSRFLSASCERKNHNKSEKKSNEFVHFHFVFSFFLF